MIDRNLKEREREREREKRVIIMWLMYESNGISQEWYTRILVVVEKKVIFSSSPDKLLPSVRTRDSRVEFM